MSSITVLDKVFVPFISASAINEQLQRLAKALHTDYAGKKPLFIPVLNGSYMFAAALLQLLDFELEVCFIKLASYKGTKSSGQVVSAIGLDINLKDRHVVILEDIVDTGRTLSHFLPQLGHQNPLSLKLCVLLHKPEATIFPLTLDYVGFTIPNKFVVGYGLDYDGYGRNLNSIYQLLE